MDRSGRILAIPLHLVFVRFIDVPSLDEPEIGKMVEFQALKQLPYSKEEMIFSYRNLGSYKQGFSSIMLVIAKRQMIERMIQEGMADGITVEDIRLHNELLYLFLLKKELLNPFKVTLVVHIGKEDSEVTLLDKNRPKFCRGFRNSDTFLEEIDRSLVAYGRDKDNPEIDNMLVTYPSIVDIEDAKLHIEEHFKIPVSFFEYSDDLTNMELPVKIELLPRQLSDEKIKARKQGELIVTYSLIGVALILVFIFLSFNIYKKTRFITLLSVEIDRIESETGHLDRLLKKIDFAKGHIEQGNLIVKILQSSYKLMPTDINISGLDYNGKETVSYKGESKDMAAIFSFVKTLESSEYFGKTEVKYAAKKKIKGEEFIDFNIECQIKI